ncbi:hypothetical protein FF1_037916 [Malus domestica]
MLPFLLLPELNSLRIFDQTLSVLAMAITVHPLKLYLRSIYGSPSKGSPTGRSFSIQAPDLQHRKGKRSSFYSAPSDLKPFLAPRAPLFSTNNDLCYTCTARKSVVTTFNFSTFEVGDN